MIVYVSASVELAHIPWQHCTHMINFWGPLTAGPWIHLCFPQGKATIFMNGTRSDISLCSNGFKQDNSGGWLSRHMPLAFACIGNASLDSDTLQHLHTHCLPSFVTWEWWANFCNSSGVALEYLVGLNTLTVCLYIIGQVEKRDMSWNKHERECKSKTVIVVSTCLFLRATLKGWTNTNFS